MSTLRPSRARGVSGNELSEPSCPDSMVASSRSAARRRRKAAFEARAIRLLTRNGINAPQRGRMRLDRFGAKTVVSIAVVVLAAAGCASAPDSASSGPSVAGVSTPAVSVSAATPSPTVDPLTVASFQGSYAIVRTVDSESEFDFQYKVGDKEERAYAVTPGCPAGPCDVSVSVTDPSSGRTTKDLTFRWADGVYRLSTTEPTADYECTKAGKKYTTQEIVTLTELRPTESAIIDGKALVTRLTMTLHYAITPVGKALAAGCTPSSVEMTGSAERLDGGSSTVASAPPVAPASPRASPVAALPARDASCKAEKTTRSKGATGMTSYTIANRTALTLTVYWLDYRGHREKWFEIAPGDSARQDTYKTHPWLVAGPKGGCLRIFKAPAKIVIG